MKTIVTSALVFFSLFGFAQTQTPASTTTTSTQTKNQKIVNTWSLTQTETFNEVHKPTTAQAKDQLIIEQDGHYRLIYNGVAEGGTWTIDKANTWLMLTKADGSVKKFKVMENTATSLKVDYKDADEIHNILYYSAGAAASK